MRLAQRGLDQVERRLAEMAAGTAGLEADSRL
jgi:hypothetical protein